MAHAAPENLPQLSGISQALRPITITRADGDQHRDHSSERGSYSGERACRHDPSRACRKGGNLQCLKDTYGSERDALATAQAEMNRIARGAATLELGRPELMPPTPVTVHGFKPEIDGTQWLVVKLSHQLGDGGLVTRVEMENGALPSDDTPSEDAEPEPPLGDVPPDDTEDISPEPPAPQEPD